MTVCGTFAKKVITEKSLEYAMAQGHLECLKYSHQLGLTSDTNFLQNTSAYRAAHFGQVQCLKYAIKNGFSWKLISLKIAVELGLGHFAGSLGVR